MKRRVLIILLAVVFCMSLVAVAACNATHECTSKCDVCGKCTNLDCKEEACKDKCQGHTPAHVCGHVCPTCGKCTDVSCTDDVCKDKCEGHGQGTDPVKVTGITITGLEDEGNENTEGTLASPFVVNIAQGHDVELGYNVRPNNADDKAVIVTVGKIENNAFTATPEVTELEVTVVGTRITIAAAADLTVGGGIVVEVKAHDGSNVATYLNIVVNEYVAVTGITSSTLKQSEEDGFDYELLTALGTNWNMSLGMTDRGTGLLAGTVDGKNGLLKPTNLVYFPNVYNLGLSVEPADASEKDYTITYSEQDIVEVASDGALSVKNAGETVISVTSDSNSEVVTKIKVTVVDAVYRGLTKTDYEAVTESTNVDGGWDLDSEHATEAQLSRFNDWRLVLVYSNLTEVTGSDEGQKIFYDGNPDRPYGIGIENYVSANSGASILESTGMMWAKVTIPAGALTFNIKMEATGTGKDYSEYRVVFVPENGEAVVMTDGWMKTPAPEATVKITVPEAIKGQKGALIVETKVSKADEHVEFHAKVLKFEGQVDVTSVEFNRTTAEYLAGTERTISNVKAVVKPDNATNDKVIYSIDPETVCEGLSVNAETGEIIVAATVPAGTYRIIATSVADENKTATFTLTLTAEEIEVNEWDSSESGKNDIIGGVSDVAWVKDGEGLDSLNEGESIQKAASVLKLENRKINATSFILSIRIRCFGGTTSEIVLKVIDGDDTFEIPTTSGQKAIPQDKGEGDWYSYDLSAYIGKTVTLTLGVKEDNDRAVVQHIKFTGNASKVTNWANKDELENTDADPWTVVGDMDSGVNLGLDIMHTDSYIHNAFVIGAYNAKFTFGARVFVRDGETYPDIKVVVKVGEEERVIRAIGAEADTVHVESDDVLPFSYDLSEFIGQEVEIRIQLANNATHCVIANISMGQMPVAENN